MHGIVRTYWQIIPRTILLTAEAFLSMRQSKAPHTKCILETSDIYDELTRGLDYRRVVRSA